MIPELQPWISFDLAWTHLQIEHNIENSNFVANLPYIKFILGFIGYF
jgi:hypothetical protein